MRPKVELFKKEDVEKALEESTHPDCGLHSGVLVEKLNRLLEQWLANSVRVYGNQSNNWNTELVEKCRTYRGDTHTALLVCIEELQPEPTMLPEIKVNPECPDNEVWVVQGYRLIQKLRYENGVWNVVQD